MADPKEKPEPENEEADASGSTTPIPHGKRLVDVDPTRFGDWELNGRCIDF